MFQHEPALTLHHPTLFSATSSFVHTRNFNTLVNIIILTKATITCPSWSRWISSPACSLVASFALHNLHKLDYTKYETVSFYFLHKTTRYKCKLIHFFLFVRNRFYWFWTSFFSGVLVFFAQTMFLVHSVQMFFFTISLYK